jgi:hypothetical protein
VLDWNKNSIDYYKKKGAINISEEEGWQAFRYYNALIITINVPLILKVWDVMVF